MKAYVLHGIGDFRYEDVEMPSPKKGEVLIKVRVAGICGSDIPRIFRTGTYSYPLIPGHEFAGDVVKTGEGVDDRWDGKRVGIFPLIPCMKCGSCRNRQYEMCRQYNYLGSRTNGGFAEYVTVPEWNLIELPKEVSYEQAAMLEPMAVAVHAMRQAFSGANVNKRPETIAVCGLGTIGTLLVMFLREFGTDGLLVIGNKDDQKETIKNLGIPEARYCDSNTENVYDWIGCQTGGDGVSLFFECVGRNETVEEAVRCTAPGGIVQFVGNPASDIVLEKNVYWKILRNQLTVKGSWNSSFRHESEDDWHYVLKRLKNRNIRPELCITHRFELEKLKEGAMMMRDKSCPHMKVMVK